MINQEPAIARKSKTLPTLNSPPVSRVTWSQPMAALLLTITYLLVAFALRVPLEQNKMPISGDEHHYITQALSLLDDGDLVVLDDYQQGLYVPYLGGELDPSMWNLIGDAGYSGHSPGVGVLTTVGIWTGGWSGVVLVMGLSMGVAFWLTTAVAEGLSGARLSPIGLFALVGGFLSLPLLSYSHTLYPESFMAPLMAGLMLIVIKHAQPAEHRQSLLAFGALSLTGLSIALHPKYSVFHVGMIAYLVVVEVWDEFNESQMLRLRRPLIYTAYGALWLLLASWLHDVMWDTFSPTGWFSSAEAGKAIEPSVAMAQFIDLFFGSEFGLFVLAPICLLGIVYFLRTLRRPLVSIGTRFTLFALIALLAIAGPAAFSSDWHGGDSPLARYLTPLVPVLLVAAAAQAQRARHRILSSFMLGLLTGTGLIWGVAYLAVPTGFRPKVFGTPGAFGVASDVAPVFAQIEAALWTSSRPSPLASTIILFAVLLGLSAWLFAKREGSASPPLGDSIAGDGYEVGAP